jgi:peptidoglycan/LPS O-acetylase OafA/YrhL
LPLPNIAQIISLRNVLRGHAEVTLMGILRLLLALAVVSVHTQDWDYPVGILAVQGFYIISGFYMTLILNEKYVGANGSYKLFMTNRLLRLYPVYWVVLSFMMIGSAWLYYRTDGGTMGYLATLSSYTANANLFSIVFFSFAIIFLFFQDTLSFLHLNTTTGSLFFSTYFDGEYPSLFSFPPDPPAWTLGVELWFYLVSPLIVRRRAWVIVGLASVSLLLRLTLYGFGLNGIPWNYRFFPNELLFFLLGTLGYKIYSYIKDNSPDKSYYTKLFAAYICMAAVFYLVFESGGLLLTVIFAAVPFIFMRAKDSRVDRWIGELSYPVYICHYFIMLFVRNLQIAPTSGVAGFAIVSACSIIFSIILNEFMVKKIEKTRQRRLSR